jgi:hypothetical protein
MNNFKKSAGVARMQSNYEITLNNEINSLRQECQRKLTSLIQRLYPNSYEMQQKILDYQMDKIALYILHARVKIANDILNSFVKLATAGPSDQIELKRLEDELEQNRRIYKLFVDQSRGSQIEEALQHTDAEFKYSIFEPARYPIYAVAGSKRNFVSLCFFVSLALGVAAIFVQEFLDQSIRSVEYIEETLQIPVWGIIPKTNAPFNSWHNNLKKLANVPESQPSLSITMAEHSDDHLVMTEK